MDGSRKSCLLSSFFDSFLGLDVDLRQFQVDGRDLTICCRDFEIQLKI